jgi:hypothetical protein
MILILRTRWRSVVSITLRPLYQRASDVRESILCSKLLYSVLVVELVSGFTTAAARVRSQWDLW